MVPAFSILGGRHANPAKVDEGIERYRYTAGERIGCNALAYAVDPGRTLKTTHLLSSHMRNPPLIFLSLPLTAHL